MTLKKKVKAILNNHRPSQVESVWRRENSITTIAYLVIGDLVKRHILCSGLNKMSVSPIPQAQGTSQKRVQERSEEPEKMVTYFEMLSSGPDMAIVFLNS